MIEMKNLARNGTRAALARLVQTTAYRLGWPALSAARRRGTLQVFYGHHVLGAGNGRADLTADELYERLVYLRRTRELVSLPEAVQWLRSPTSDRLAAVTFDDGYRDNLTNLLPVLQATSTPATIFVSTEPIVDGGHLWFDQVRAALWDDATELHLPWLSESVHAGPSKADRVVAHLYRCDPARRRRCLAEALAQLPSIEATPESHCEVLTPSQIQELAAEPLVTIGAHTHSHTRLGTCSEPVAEGEIRTNIAELRRLTGAEAVLFAYPRGRDGDCGDRDQQLLERMGIEAAFTTQHGAIRPGDNPLALGRLPLGAGELPRFAWQNDISSRNRPRS